MGKIKVHEIAKKMGIGTSEVIEKLKKMGIEVKSHMSSVEKDVADKLAGKKEKTVPVKEESKKETSPKDNNPHIIRRKVKVISTDEKGNEIENITTKSGNTIERKSVIHKKAPQKNSYSKEGLGVVKSNYSKNNYGGYRNQNMSSSIVVTRNGKPVESDKASEKIVTENEKVNVTENRERRTGNMGEKRQYNNEERRPYNNTNQGERRPYNNTNQGERRPYNNTNQGERRPYNNTNQGERRPYNNTNQGERRPYNNTNQGERRPYNNTNQGEGRPYNRDNNSGGYNNRRPYNDNRNQTNTTSYKINQYIKEVSQTPVMEKETRDYTSNVLFDKRKGTKDKGIENKKEKLDKNQMREADTRIDFNMFRGLEVDSSSDRIMEFYDRGTSTRRKYGSKKRKTKPTHMNKTKIIPLTEVKLNEVMTVKEFAEAIKTQSSEIIKKLFGLGIMATVNQEIDFDTAYLIASEMGINATKQVVVTEEDVLFDDSEDDEKDMTTRPPIVTVMGHVDHGKTSLLDYIRHESVATGEAGGITQHIGAYKITTNRKEVTFLDTPGHEAFTEMRARGAQVTDIAIIVVAADDGIKPQTLEAINHAKAAEVSIIVAINKIDKPTANIERVKQELLEAELVPEEWGGDTIIVPVSAHTGEGMKELLEMILLVSEVKDFKTNPKKQAKGTVIEARLDKSKGTIASLLVQRGTLNIGDTIVVGEMIGKVRSMTNDRGEQVEKAGPSTPVEILGLPTVPQTGDVFYEVKDEKTANKLIDKRKAVGRNKLIKQGCELTLDDLFTQIKDCNIKELNIIIKADVQGSVEAIKDSLLKLSNEEVKVKVIHGAAGGINESDVTLAKVSNAIIIGFNVKPDPLAASFADREKVDLRLYNIIYDAIDDVERAMKGLKTPTYKEVKLGEAEVRTVFKATNIGTIAGSYITSGKIVRNALVRVMRDSKVVHEGKIESIKREKDDVKEIAEGYECGIKIEKFSDVKELDILECYEMQEEE
ncbi:MAG: translation initiation factor IF-2 [Clostridia bacterium]|nr:translation initiation factor IF-2 [Clostridia bacterium]